MQFHKGTFLKRYKRFFADVITSDNEPLTIHCPNTGAMTGLLQEGVEALFTLATPQEMKTRKTPGTLEALRVFVEGDQKHYWVGVNTHRANQIAQNWLESEAACREFAITSVRSEVKLQQLYNTLVKKAPELAQGDVLMKTRVDFCVERENQKPLLIEVKSATLYQDKQGFFPDAVSKRATQQLQDMLFMQDLGFDVMILYVSQHQAIEDVKPAEHIDKEYAALVSHAKGKGIIVKTLTFDAGFYGVE